MAKGLQMDRQRIRDLRDEARALADAPAVTREQVEDWRQRTALLLDELYGAGSETYQEFAEIKFDDGKIIDVAERVIRKEAEQSGADISDLRIRLPAPEKALRRGLYEAADGLTALIMP